MRPEQKVTGDISQIAHAANFGASRGIAKSGVTSNHGAATRAPGSASSTQLMAIAKSGKFWCLRHQRCHIKLFYQNWSRHENVADQAMLLARTQRVRARTSQDETPTWLYALQ